MQSTCQSTVQRLAEAARALARLDPDLAQYENGVGYSSADGHFGHALAVLPVAEWTPEITRDAWEMLRRYKTQLSEHGIDVSEIEEPPTYADRYRTVDSEYASYTTTRGRMAARSQARELVAAQARRIRHAEGADGAELVMESEYDAGLVAKIRSLPGRRWDARRKVNCFPTSSAAALVAFAEAEAFWVDETTRQLAEQEPIQPNADPELNVAIEDDEIRIRFPFDRGTVQRVKKAVVGVRWEPKGKYWHAPLQSASGAVDFVEGTDLTIAEAVRVLAGRVTAEMEERKAASQALDADVKVPGLAPGIELMPFQRAGVAYAASTRRCFVADEMGLGKTIQALAAVALESALPAVVVCPNLAKGNWPREVRKFFPDLSVHVVNGTKPEPLPAVDITIVNYDIVDERSDDLVALGPRALILDECHYTKNGTEKVACPHCGGKVRRNAKRCSGCQGTFDAPEIRFTVRRTNGCARVSRAIPPDGMVLLLSGTPVPNRPVELVNQLKILGRLDDFGGEFAFKKRFCGAHQNGWGWDFSGASNTVELHERLRAACYVRRLKQDVYPELPARRHVPCYQELAPAAMQRYRKIEADVVEELARRARELAEEAGEDGDAAYWQKRMRAEAAEHLVRIGVCMRAAADARFEQGAEWVSEFLENNPNDKIILFAFHVDVVEGLAKRFGDMAVKVRGGVSQEARMQAVDRFQGDPTCRVFVGNFAAAKEALTLTAASNVAFFEMEFTPATHDQAIDRCYGRVNDLHGACGTYFMAPGTIDEEIWTLLERKRVTIDAVTDGKERASKGKESLLADLIIKMTERGLAASSANDS